MIAEAASRAPPKRISLGPRVIRWIEAYCVIPDGPLIGQPFRIPDWWRQVLFEWYEMVADGADGMRRRYSQGLIGIPKKNLKALAVDTPIATPRGWTTMGELQVGDIVFDALGERCRVTATSSVMVGNDCYVVRFSDGAEVIADAGHLWFTETRKPEGGAGIKTTDEIRRSLWLDYRGSAGWNHRVPVAGPLMTWTEAELPIPPYVLGAWLGDGSSHAPVLACSDADIGVVEQIRAEGVTATRRDFPSEATRCPSYLVGRGWLSGALRRLGVLNNKHIPTAYLRASLPERWALLQGLMDTDGTATKRGQCIFANSRERLADDVVALLRTLGYKPTKITYEAKLNGLPMGDTHAVQFWAFKGTPVFRLRRKADRQKVAPLVRPRSRSRHIVAVEPAASVPVRCIQVDSPTELFLAGEGLVPTHNTSLAAAMALYELAGSEDPAALVLSAASTEDQGSNLLYGSAKTMALHSPQLKDALVAMDKEISVPSQPRARMRNLTNKAGSQDGLNARAIFCDELHEWIGMSGRRLFAVLEGALTSRPDATLLAITTAGYDEDSLCYEKYEYGKKVQLGLIDDPRFFFRWLEAPDGCDIRDRKFWIIANPLLGITVHESVLEDRVLRDPESVFRRYHLNQWVSGEDIWIPSSLWDQAKHPELAIRTDLPVHVGIDVGIRHDSSAVVVAQRQSEIAKTIVRARVWENPYPRDHSLHDTWSLAIEEIEQYLRDLHEMYPEPACEIDDEPKPGPEFSYDPFFFERSAQLLSGEGLAMVEFPQSDQRMIPASQTLHDVIVEGGLAHDGDPILRRHILSAIADQKARGWRLSKPKGSQRKIDAAIAAAIAVYTAQAHDPEPEESVYETRGVLFI